MARTFNPKAIGVATVGERDGKLLALDGVHRSILAFMAGAERIPAAVEEIADQREAAMIYSVLNVGRKAVSSHSKSRSTSMINAESTDRQLAGTLEGLSMRVVQSDIGGPAMARRMLKWVGQEGFIEGVRLHEVCWPGVPVKPEFVGVFGWMAAVYGVTADDAERDDSSVAAVMLEQVEQIAANPNHLLNEVEVKGPGYKHGEVRVQAIVEHLVKLLNKDRKGKDRLNPNDLPWSEKSIQKAKEAQQAAKAAARAAKALPKTVAAENVKAAKEIATWETGTTIAQMREEEDRVVILHQNQQMADA